MGKAALLKGCVCKHKYSSDSRSLPALSSLQLNEPSHSLHFISRSPALNLLTLLSKVGHLLRLSRDGDVQRARFDWAERFLKTFGMGLTQRNIQLVPI